MFVCRVCEGVDLCKYMWRGAVRRRRRRRDALGKFAWKCLQAGGGLSVQATGIIKLWIARRKDKPCYIAALLLLPFLQLHCAKLNSFQVQGKTWVNWHLVKLSMDVPPAEVYRIRTAVLKCHPTHETTHTHTHTHTHTQTHTHTHSNPRTNATPAHLFASASVSAAERRATRHHRITVSAEHNNNGEEEAEVGEEDGGGGRGGNGAGGGRGESDGGGGGGYWTVAHLAARIADRER